MSELLREPRAGDIWLVDMDPQVGREQGGIRPALVVSNEYFNRLPNDLHVIVPTTTRNRGLRLHVPVLPPEGGLRRPSLIMCDQVKAASVNRLLERWGAVEEDTLLHVLQILDLIFEQEDPVMEGIVPEKTEARHPDD